MFLFTSGVAELTRHRAERIARDLVKAGDVREQTSALVRDLLERNRQNRQELLRFLRDEVRNQVQNLGLAAQRDLDRLERRVARLESERRETRPVVSSKSSSRARSDASSSSGASARATPGNATRAKRAAKTSSRAKATRATTTRSKTTRSTDERASAAAANPQQTGGDGS